MTFNEMLDALIEKRQKLDELKKNPELAEALKVSDEYHGLLQDLMKWSKDVQYIPIYPAQPAWGEPRPPYKITIGDSTRPMFTVKDNTTNVRP